MTNIWEQFDNNTDLEEFEQGVKNAENQSGDFEDLPHGKYEVALQNIELKPTKKKGDPMIVSVFKVIEGNHKGRLIWVNQVVDTPVKMNIGLRFINDMKPDTKVSFDKSGGMSKLAEDLVDAGEEISKTKEFVLEFGQNKKGYDQYSIETVFELED